MTDGPDKLLRFRSVGSETGESTVETLASRALRVLAAKRVTAVSLMSERFLSDLETAARTVETGRRRAVLRDMLEAGIRREDIVDFYIPEAARRLGASWCEDGIGFADVTIGVARMQGMLREIGADWLEAVGLAPDAPGVMVLVTEDEHHTLGSMVLASQLRRMGVAVKLVVGRSESEILRLVASNDFDAFLISTSQGEKLASIKNLIEKIRAASSRPAPVIVGGPVIVRETDVKKQTGADHATTDPREALRLCGLKTSHPGARRRATSE